MNMAYINPRASNFKVKQKEDTPKRLKNLMIKPSKDDEEGPRI